MPNPIHTATGKKFITEQKEMQAELASLELKQALLHGNILEIRSQLPAHVTAADFERFMGDQWKTWKSQLLQDVQPYVEPATPDELRIQDFPIQSGDSSLKQGDGEELIRGMMSSLTKGKFKATKAEGTGEEAKDKVDSDYQNLTDTAEGTLGEWDSFMSEMWGQIFDAQMVQDYQKKMGEVQKEVQRIIAMAKSGQIDPEYVLIALAKVNVTKNGCLMTWLGKKAFMTNETMNRVSEDLKKTPQSDILGYQQKLQDTQAKTRDGAFQLQLLVADMQKVMQDVAGVLEQVHGFMGEINRTRREIIQKFTATG